MRYLLDTHVFIWSVLNTKKISEKVLNILEDSNQQIFVSAVSFWELSLKYSIGKLNLNLLKPEMFPSIALDMNYKNLPLSVEESSSFHTLEGGWHKDPFDRMLIVQAMENNLTLITKDENIAKYAQEGLKVIW
ncbi:MAG TPA: type II toxin-antitoxin system VapC family toxin [Pelobium sp.]|nr:type II toxin-antitoxin system VapC family toxin [Pelobium sp.]